VRWEMWQPQQLASREQGGRCLLHLMDRVGSGCTQLQCHGVMPCAWGP
jgi:hypothetical protein